MFSLSFVFIFFRQLQEFFFLLFMVSFLLTIPFAPIKSQAQPFDKSSEPSVDQAFEKTKPESNNSKSNNNKDLTKSAESLFLKGLAAYNERNFSDASNFFLKSLEFAPNAPNTLLNLSYSEHKNENIGNAVLYARKALRAKRPFWKANKQLLKLEKELPMKSLNDSPLAHKFKEKLILLPYGFIAIISLICLFWWATKNRFKLHNFFKASFIAFLFFSLILLAQIYFSSKDLITLTTKEAELKISPSEDSAKLSMLFEGEELELIHDQDQWIQVSDENGFIGWAKASNFRSHQGKPLTFSQANE